MRRSMIVFASLLLMLGWPPGSASAEDGSLRGNQISLLASPDPITIPASEPSFIQHGWGFPLHDIETAPGVINPGWADMSAEERQERFEDAVWRFELLLDGSPIPLERAMHFDLTCGPEGCMTKSFFVQFEAGQFPLGTTVVFEGRWYGDSDDDDVGELELTLARTVTFT